MSNKSLAILVTVLITFIIVVLILTRGPSPSAITQQRLAALEQAVVEYANKNKSLPKSLSDLDIGEEAISDHAGVPFVYQVEGNQVRIVSYGADGKPGGHSFREDTEVLFSWPK